MIAIKQSDIRKELTVYMRNETSLLSNSVRSCTFLSHRFFATALFEERTPWEKTVHLLLAAIRCTVKQAKQRTEIEWRVKMHIVKEHI